MSQYNDYELLYLINEFDEEAEKILFDKYSNLIKARIYKFKIKDRYRDDFLQEGLFMLVIAIRTYDEYSHKSFNKYFDLILQRRFMRLMQREQDYIYNVDLVEEPSIIKDSSSFQYDNENISEFSELEQKVFILKSKNFRPKEIAKVLDCDVKSVYNCLCRIKKKYYDN